MRNNEWFSFWGSYPMKMRALKDLGFKDLLEDAASLNPFYTNTRCPVHWPMDFTRQDAENARESAQKIGDFVKKKIGDKI